MSCVVGWIENGSVVIGGDAAAVWSLHVTQRVAPKVFANGPMALGFAGSFRVGDLLEYALKVPDRKRRETVDAYMRTTFIDAVRKCLADGGCAEKENGVEKGGEFLVGYEGRLFGVDSDYQVGENRDGFEAIGCAAELARGALAAMHRLKVRLPVKTRLQRALEIAARYSGGVSPPFAFVRGGASTAKRAQ